MIVTENSMVLSELTDHHELIGQISSLLVDDITRACEMVTDIIKQGNKIFLAGNGGSAADAQHIAAEFTGRFVKERKPLPAIALTTDTSALTAIANDYSFHHVFSRQFEALARPGDLFIGISTSGNSEGILRVFQSARAIGCRTLGLSGKGGGKMNDECELNVVIPSDITARIQEMHILIGHILCKAADDLF